MPNITYEKLGRNFNRSYWRILGAFLEFIDVKNTSNVYMAIIIRST